MKNRQRESDMQLYDSTIVAMAGPKCSWPIPRVAKQGEPAASGSDPCGSQERVFEVKGHGKHTGRPRSGNVCERHIPDAIREWNWDTIEPCGTGGQ